MDDDLRSEITEDVVLRLSYYVERKVRARVRLMRGRAAGLGFTTEDIVPETIRRVLDTRNWNRDRYPEALDYLRGVADSVISDLRRGAETQRTRPLGEIEEAQLPSPSPSASEAALQGLIVTRLKRDMESDQDPELLRGLLDAAVAGFRKTDEIADVLGADPGTVANGRRRLRRLLERALDEVPP